MSSGNLLQITTCSLSLGRMLIIFVTLIKAIAM
jgi:hypothetical protein